MKIIQNFKENGVAEAPSAHLKPPLDNANSQGQKTTVYCIKMICSEGQTLLRTFYYLRTAKNY